MKNLLIFGLAIVLFTACETQEKRYTQQSLEIDTYKKVIDAYEKQNWEAIAMHYADTAKIFNNATNKNPQSVAELIEQDKKDASLFSSWDYVDAESEYEMVVTDKDETWVNFWGLWQGTLKANNKLYQIPTHITVQFVDGKIVREHGYWDVSKLVTDLEQLERDAAITATDSLVE